MTNKPECPIIDLAWELSEQVEIGDIPSDSDAGDMWYNQVLAHLRHGYTNYEELLLSLNACCHSNWQDCGPDCLDKEIAHGILKQAAKRVADLAYTEWLDTKQAMSKSSSNASG
jgi:hypothetical protein